MSTSTHYPTDFESYNAMKAAPANHRPEMDSTTHNILDRLLIDLMHIRDFEFDTDTNLNGYIGMDIFTSVLARLIGDPLPDNVTALVRGKK
jgi:hypothetical protein